jgi:hypothetical protein
MDCGRHFTSLPAFDSHREGKFRIGRYCVDPIELKKLSSETSFCRIAEGKEKGESVTVWFDLEAKDKMAKVFEGRR